MIHNMMKHAYGAIKNWWISLLVGILAVTLGIACLCTPLAAFNSLAVLFETALLLGGILEIIYAFANSRISLGWGWILLGGLADLAFALFLIFQPIEITSTILTYLAGIWIVFRCFWAVGNAIELGMFGVRGWGWVILLAILGIIFAVWFFFSTPAFGGIFIVALFACAAISYGIFRICAGLLLRKVWKQIKFEEAKEMN
ncbi:MAG: DUF308 domain-containing protein [Bacteroidales bacterium]|nr:DUF308 domain-containing protein [Bacteroidales bacterium]